MTEKVRALRIGVHGQQHDVIAIRLYPENEVAAWQGMLRSGHEKMGGFSSGLGLFGSPGWVLGGAAVLGAIEAKISDAKARDGISLLRAAAVSYSKLRKLGRMVPLQEIDNLHQASPETWSTAGAVDKLVDLNKLPMLDRGAFLRKHGLGKTDVRGGMVRIPSKGNYVVLGEDFLEVETPEEVISVRWSAVATYRYLPA
jgi:hypothetical protein